MSSGLPGVYRPWQPGGGNGMQPWQPGGGASGMGPWRPGGGNGMQPWQPGGGAGMGAFWGQPASPPTAPDPRRMAYPTRLPPDQRCYTTAGTEVPCHGNPPGHYNDPKINGGEWKDPGTGEVYRGPEVGTTNGGQGYGDGGGGGGGTQAGGADFPLYLQELFRNYAKAGYFDPGGNRQMIEAGRMNAGNIAGGQQRQMQLMADARGMDPTQRGSYAMQGALGAQGTQARLINDSLMEAWRNQNQFAQGLGMAWGGQPTLPPDTSPGPADYALQLILAYMGKKLP